MKSLLLFAFVAGLGFASAADPPRDLFYECTPEFDGFVIRYAVGDRPNQIVYVYLCDGSEWTLIDVET
jgi:hypothetical protein